MAPKTKACKGKGKKYGKNSAKCKRYIDENRREKNKKRKIAKLKKKYEKNRKKRLAKINKNWNGSDRKRNRWKYLKEHKAA